MENFGERPAPVKCPARIIVVEAIPAGRSGKVERRALAREWLGLPPYEHSHP